MAVETIDFTGTNDDPWPSGWTFDLPSGSGPTTSIQGNRGRGTTSTAARDLYAVRTADSLLDSDVTFVMAATTATAGPADMIGPVSRYASASVCYRARARYDNNTIELTRNGTQVGTFQPNGGAGYDAAWRIRLRTTVSGSDALVQVRYWEASAAEPGTWQIEYTDTAPLSAGKCGVFYNFQTSGVQYDIDDYVRDDLVSGEAHTRTITRVVSTHTG